MNKHLDVFLALVAIVGVGHANSFLGQSLLQQQQQGLGGFGGTVSGALDRPFSGGSRGNLGEDLRSSIGNGLGRLGESAAGRDPAGMPGSMLGSGNGNGMAAAGLGGFLGGGPEGALNPGGVGPAGRGTNAGVFGGASSPAASSGFPAGPQDGTRGIAGLPGLSGELGNGLRTPGGMAGPLLDAGSRGLEGRGSTQAGPLEATRGIAGLPGLSGELGNGLSTSGGMAGPPSDAGSRGLGGRGSAQGVGGSPTFGTPSTTEGPTFGTGPGSFAAGQPGPGGSGRELDGGSVGSGAGATSLGAPSGTTGGASGIEGSGALAPTETGAQGSRPGLRGRNPSGNRVGPNRRPRKPHKELTPAEKAAIGLGVGGGLLALGALTAGLASVIQQGQNKRQGRPGQSRLRCSGCQRPPCLSGCGRQRRSIPQSKVSPDILDRIPVNLERLY